MAAVVACDRGKARPRAVQCSAPFGVLAPRVWPFSTPAELLHNERLPGQHARHLGLPLGLCPKRAGGANLGEPQLPGCC
eukprot:scaffold929_cov387-Prasinococcus_capsulatus_cf.AAC.7